MKIKYFIIIFSIGLITGCSSGKDTAQRRNLMIPEKHELPRNSKYSGTKKKKTYSVKKQKKRKSYYYGNIVIIHNNKI
jgi:hypothetical protein